MLGICLQCGGGACAFYRFFIWPPIGDEAGHGKSQTSVREGALDSGCCSKLSQIPTIWNVSDIGTKALGVQRTQLLLHELNIASSPDFFVVGMPEYERQCQRHGGNKQLTKLVKHVTRVLVMMGLESSTASGVAAISMLDCDDSSSYGTCMIEPNIQVSGGVNVSYILLAFFFGMFLGVLVVLYKTYKRARDAFESYEHMYTQMAILDSAYNRLQDQYEGLREQHFTDIGHLGQSGGPTCPGNWCAPRTNHRSE